MHHPSHFPALTYSTGDDKFYEVLDVARRVGSGVYVLRLTASPHSIVTPHPFML